jgi:hypothetical protein
MATGDERMEAEHAMSVATICQISYGVARAAISMFALDADSIESEGTSTCCRGRRKIVCWLQRNEMYHKIDMF